MEDQGDEPKGSWGRVALVVVVAAVVLAVALFGGGWTIVHHLQHSHAAGSQGKGESYPEAPPCDHPFDPVPSHESGVDYYSPCASLSHSGPTPEEARLYGPLSWWPDGQVRVSVYPGESFWSVTRDMTLQQRFPSGVQFTLADIRAADREVGNITAEARRQHPELNLDELPSNPVGFMVKVQLRAVA